MTEHLEEALQHLYEADKRAYHSATPESIREPIVEARTRLEAYLRHGEEVCDGGAGLMANSETGGSGRTCIFHVGVEAEQDLMLENPETGERELRPVCGDCWYHAFGHKEGFDVR